MFNKRHVALQDGHILWGEFRRNYPIVLIIKKKRAHTVVRYSEPLACFSHQYLAVE